MDPIVVDALVVQARDGHIRIILGNYCLDFETEDILEIAELPSPNGLVEGSALPARVTLRAGAKLFRLASSAPYSEALWRWRKPFVFSTRTEPVSLSDPEMARKEADFFRARGEVLPDAVKEGV